MVRAGTIFLRWRKRTGMVSQPYFRVVGCSCGNDGHLVDHHHLRTAEDCARRIIRQRRQERQLHEQQQ
jgi:hypothetical protein